MVALDTNVAIELLRGKLTLPLTLQTVPQALPIIVAGELLFGAQNSGRRLENLAAHRSFILDLEVLLLDNLAAEYYAEIRLALKHKGRPIPENDMWIASICRAHDVALLTFDKHFAEISDLQLVSL